MKMKKEQDSENVTVAIEDEEEKKRLKRIKHDETGTAVKKETKEH